MALINLKTYWKLKTGEVGKLVGYKNECYKTELRIEYNSLKTGRTRREWIDIDELMPSTEQEYFAYYDTPEWHEAAMNRRKKYVEAYKKRKNNEQQN